MHDAGAIFPQSFGLFGGRRSPYRRLPAPSRPHCRAPVAEHQPSHARRSAGRLKILNLVERQTLFPGGADNRISQWMFSFLIEAGGQTKHLIHGDAETAIACSNVGRPSVRVPALVDNQRVDLAHPFNGRRIPERDA